ncbi:type VI secretion system protein TssA [Citrobacter portucalensis]|uniref:type VI secretion system protein TssA n=1 Tax=Citrobacter portucalensis TaxID=1639133 RepID=UPI00226BB989|nr:type VI secretion system protein TssA [Citrobacter portucalensis]MCX9039074.1 type VI secretion system protein TssA [Citrobacter portucalensis]MCX9063283.1 type VI secretion system protein TssA [Citrobacter portucalensis]
MLQDIANLLAPISQENPGGENLEYEPLFDDICRARESDAVDLPQGEWLVKEPRIADWDRVRTLSEQALATQSKDLQLACWFTEALCHQQGLAGVHQGIEFLNEFIIRFWFHCWPAIDDDGVSQRRSKLQRLDRDLSLLVSGLPMLRRQSNTTLTYWRQIMAFEHKINLTPGIREDLIFKEGDLTISTFNEQATHFSAIDINQQISIVDSIITAFSQLEARYASLSQDSDGELFGLTRQTLYDLNDFLQRMAQLVTPTVNEEIPPPQMLESNEASQPLGNVVRPKVQTTNRELAIAQIQSIAGFFRQTEPSSPVPFLLDRAARWANMTLTEWLEEMLNDPNSIHQINNVLTGESQ